jgi:opacity protein-like surface antigen
MTVEVLLNDVVAGTGTTSPEGEVSVDLKMAQPEQDSNIYVDVCEKSRRVLVVDHNKRPPAPPAGCERRDISGIFWVRPINTLVVDVSGTQPTMLLVRGAYNPPKPQVEGEEESGPKFETPTGLTLFGAGSWGKFSEAISVACGNVACDGNDGGIGYSFGGGFWFTPWLGVQGGYIAPRKTVGRGGGDGFSFNSEFDVDLFNVAAVAGVPAGRARIYGLIGTAYHQSTTGLSQTIAGQTQVFAQRTHGWGLQFGGGAEVWVSPKLALFGELSLTRVKGKAEDGGDGLVDDGLRNITVGVKIRLGR